VSRMCQGLWLGEEGWRGVDWGLLLAVAGVIVGLVSAVAAVFAAVYGVRAVRAARAAADLADRRWVNQIRPRPRVDLLTQGGGFSVSSGASASYTQTMTVDNSGGAITDGFVVVRLNDTFYGGHLSLPGNTGNVQRTLIRRGHSPSVLLGYRVALLYVQDMDGCWWDALAEVKIPPEAPPGPSDSPAFQAWIDRRLAEVSWPNDDAVT